MIFPLDGIHRFAQIAEIPSRDRGWIPCWPLFGGQRHALDEMARGFESDIHEYVILAGRQMGKTTLFDLLDLYWPQKFSGITGMMVSDNDANRDYRRDVLRQMLTRLPAKWRYPVRLDNQLQLAWEGIGSRLMFDAVGQRHNKSFGRSRGINYVHGDEVGAWPSQRAVQALRAALSDRHPHRLYGWPSTAQGHDVFKDLWDEAEHSPIMRQIFLGWWRHEPYRVERTNGAVWSRYGDERFTDEERIWLEAVRRRYGVYVSAEQLVWYRYALDALFLGDEDMRAQEVPWLPEDAFVSFGTKFFRPALVRSLRERLDNAPTPQGYRFQWDRWLDTSEILKCDPETTATLTVWEEPDPEGVYLIACHPAFSSSPTARDDVIQVWRCYPDQMVQAAEYVFEGGDLTIHCAWASIHLGGLYRMNRPLADFYFVMDMEATGYAVSQEMQRIETRGASLSPRNIQGKRDVQNLIGAVRHYLFRRPDSFTSGFAKEWKSQSSFRPWVLNQLRDAVETGLLEIRSPELVAELAGVRRDLVDADVIAAGGGETSECRVLAMAMATEYWLDQIQGEIEGRFKPKAEPKAGRHIGEVMVGNLLHRIERTGR